MNRFLVALAMVVLAWTACGKTPAPRGAEQPPQASVDKAPETPPPAAMAPDASAPTEAPTEAPAPASEAEGGPALDRDALARCYTAVYCAQKKGEMSRLLAIYKEFGFETPQAFTKAWIEAAKDTEWVTRMAYDVSKKCP